MSETNGAGNDDFSFAEALISVLAGENGGLQELIGIGYKVLNNPIIVTDKSWKAIAKTEGVDVQDDTGWLELTEKGLLSPETVSVGIREKMADRIDQSTGPFKWQSIDMKYPRVFSKICINNKSVATLSVIEYNKEFEESDYPKLKILCGAISAELQKNQFQQYTRGMMYEDFIWNLLEGRLQDPKAVEERVKLLNLGFKKNIYVFIFDLLEYDTNQYSLTYMRDFLEKMISGGHALIYEDKIVVTASFLRARDIFKTELRNLGEFLKKYNIRCGISRRCTCLTELRFYYKQALDALRIGTHMDFDRYIYPYGEYAIYHIAQVMIEAGGTKTFCHPALEVLLSHDREYGTSFTDSLYIYLKAFKNVTNAANLLHLHRNTMVYHLKRIEEIMEVSLDNYNIVQLIELSFRLLEYDKVINRSEPWDEISDDNK